MSRQATQDPASPCSLLWTLEEVPLTQHRSATQLRMQNMASRKQAGFLCPLSLPNMHAQITRCTECQRQCHNCIVDPGLRFGLFSGYKLQILCWDRKSTVLGVRGAFSSNLASNQLLGQHRRKVCLHLLQSHTSFCTPTLTETLVLLEVIR